MQPQSLRFWNDEIRQMKTQIEELTGNKITRKNLKEAIEDNAESNKSVPTIAGFA